MDKQRVIEAVKIIKNECGATSCDYCDFCNDEGDCTLQYELMTAPAEIDIEVLEECKNEYCSD